MTKPNFPLPLTIISGFLGAGKTTLLNNILHADHGLRVAVLVNDFGAINIDSQLIVGVDADGDTVSLSNGCICCTIRSDLIEAVAKIIKRDDPPEYIIVETSGVSDPIEVALTFRVPQLERFVKVDAIITVIDAEQVRSLTGEMEMLAFSQVGMADIIVLNKVDLVTPEKLTEVRAWIHSIVGPGARILETSHAQVPMPLLLGIGQFDPLRLERRPAHDVHVHSAAEADGEHDHDHVHTDHSLVFNTWNWATDQPLSLKAVRKVVEALPPSIYRAKGVLYLADAPEKRGILHVVGRRASLSMGEPWGDATPYTQIVVIGSAGGVDAAALHTRFTSTLAANAPGSELERLSNTVMGWLRRK